MGGTRPFKRGDVLFGEGEPCGHVIHVTSGEIEISRLVGGLSIVLGRVGQGQFVGEMAAIEGRLHSATARAACDGAAEVIDAHTFLARVSHNPALAHDLIQRLSMRLREADDELIHNRAPAAHADGTGGSREAAIAAAPSAAAQLDISAHSPDLRAKIGGDAFAITRLPFVVGRRGEGGESNPKREVDLSITDRDPMRLSRRHFQIERRLDGFVVRDLASTLGTNVNGHAIGRHFASDSAPLQVGENRIVAGGWGSPFEFRVTVHPVGVSQGTGAVAA